MSARTKMTRRTTVERDVATATGSWGKAPPQWRRHLINLPCFTWVDSGTEVEDGGKTAVVQDRNVIVPLGSDVTAGDRLSKVTDRRGLTKVKGPLNVLSANVREDHLALQVEAVSSG